MIKEVIEKKFDENLELVVEEIINYFGKEHESEIRDRMQKVKLSIIRDEGVYKYGDDEIYIEYEPVCIKGSDGTIIVLPLSLLWDRRGNVGFVHCLLDALGEAPFVKDNKSVFNGAAIDFMAEQICKLMEEKSVNAIMAKDPIYKSASFYSSMFGEIGQFCEENKEKIFQRIMGEDIKIEKEEEFIDWAEQVVNKLFERPMVEKDFIIKRT